ncbi:hypothetical protein KY342_06275 [Candidatus Woesearchaeota archaeon]|nr:hypothetical protein [Candidatus Woesearchaeota archaeon]
MSNQEIILNTIKMKGPVIPNQIAKVIETSILFASAHLSELASSNKLKISNTKIGGTPVYYLPGQESRLQELYKHLNDKQQKAFNLLKEKKILRDSELEPVNRVALREIKDFAVPLQITANNEKILFWKWYLLTNDEAGVLIKSKLNISQQETKKQIPEVKQTQKIEKPQTQPQPEPLREIQKPKIQTQPHSTKEIKKQTSEITKPKAIEKQIKLHQEQEEKKQKKPSILKRIFKPKEDYFLKDIQKFFESKRIKIIEHNILRKNSEIDAIVKFSSAIGELKYYCKAKNKKNINEIDLTNAIAQGQFKKLPVLFLIKGNLSKKAEELLNAEFSKGLIIKKME